jgi:putative FmdB family regulatory protein
MPNYEYLCQKCGHRFEKIQKFSDAMLKKCPECGGKIEQVISAPAVQFKGGGWYVTDYAKKTSPPSASGSDSGSNSGSKTDSGKDSGSGKDSAAKKDGKLKAETSAAKSDKK